MPAPITPDDLYRFRWIDHVRLSPDGERVAYQIGWADAASRQNRSRIVVRRLLDREPVEPTGATLRDHSPEWSPDGSKLAFISKVGPADQLFVLDVTTGGGPQQLSTMPEGASGPCWSPDGRYIAFVGSVLSDPEAVVDDPRPPEGREQVRRAPVARIVRRLDYKHDGGGYVDGRHHHLFVVPAKGGDVKQLTSGAWDVNEFDWAPDGTRLVVAGNAEPGADLQRELNLYLVDLDASRVRLGGGFYLSSPIWSPKGDLIAFIAPNGLDAGLIERLWIVPVGGGGPRCLTASFDQAVNDSLINDMRAGHATRVCWSTEGDRVYFIASGPGVSGIHSVDLEGNVREEAGGRRRIYDFDVARGVFAYCASEATSPGELFMLTQGAEARLTDLNPWLHDRYVAQPEQEYFTAPDGWRLEGWVLKPPGFDPDKLYPTVMEIHGGPHGQYGWTFFHELQILAGMGFVVFYMNPRGSDGYGERFRREVVRDWAGADYADLMASLDQAIERTGYIDPNRLGVGGGSYGGYMTNWIIGQTDRFAAAVSMRSISNLVSEYSQHDIVLWGTLELGAPPWPNLDELWRRSPIRYVQNIRTPLLLTAGEMDLRCAMSQSEELFGAMRLLGKQVELVRFPEESHDLSRNGRPDRRVERLRRIAAWYEAHLGTEAVARAAPEEVTQILPVPAEAPHEWAKTVAIANRTAEIAAAIETATPAADSAVGVAEPEVIQPVVPEFATAPTPIVEPEALPDLPAPGEMVAEPAPEPELELQPAPIAMSRGEAEPVELAELDRVDEPVLEPLAVLPTPDTVRGPVIVEPAAVEAEPEPEPVAATATGPAAVEAEPEPQAVVAMEPPAVEAEPGPPAIEVEAESVGMEAEPEPEPELVAAAATEPAAVEAEPEPVVVVATEAPALEAGPEPEPVAAEAPAAPKAEPAQAPREDAGWAPQLSSQPAPQPAPEPVVQAVHAVEAVPPAAAEVAAQPEATLPAAGEPAPQPEPEPVASVAASAPEVPAAPHDVNATLVAWPPGSPAPAPTNGAPAEAASFEEATSVIPAWEQTNQSADPKRTVSLQALPPEEVASGAGYAALLTFESGPFAGRIVALPDQMVTIGRAPDNDVVVGDPATSGHHGRIEVRAGSFWISDLGSTNGTLVNGDPVIEKQLSDGDMIAIGQNTLRFTLEA